MLTVKQIKTVEGQQLKELAKYALSLHQPQRCLYPYQPIRCEEQGEVEDRRRQARIAFGGERIKSCPNIWNFRK